MPDNRIFGKTFLPAREIFINQFVLFLVMRLIQQIAEIDMVVGADFIPFQGKSLPRIMQALFPVPHFLKQVGNRIAKPVRIRRDLRRFFQKPRRLIVLKQLNIGIPRNNIRFDAGRTLFYRHVGKLDGLDKPAHVVTRIRNVDYGVVRIRIKLIQFLIIPERFLVFPFGITHVAEVHQRRKIAFLHLQRLFRKLRRPVVFFQFVIKG